MKTRVFKEQGKWWCEYHLPYSGHLAAPFDTWQEAMDEVWLVEAQRVWL